MSQPEGDESLPDLEALRAADLGLPTSTDEQNRLWLLSTDPVEMMYLLEPSFADEVISDRKIRLFVCACCRLSWDTLSSDTKRNHVELTERFVDGQASRAEFDVKNWTQEQPKDLTIATCCRWNFDPYDGLYYLLYEIVKSLQTDNASTDNAATQAALVRDIFQVPYPTPVTFDPAWRTSTVVGVAETIYADRTFGNLPILADALQDAGCDHPDILTHLRGPGPHVRGCWALDLVLGKE